MRVWKFNVKSYFPFSDKLNTLCKPNFIQIECLRNQCKTMVCCLCGLLNNAQRYTLSSENILRKIKLYIKKQRGIKRFYLLPPKKEKIGPINTLRKRINKPTNCAF